MKAMFFLILTFCMNLSVFADEVSEFLGSAPKKIDYHADPEWAIKPDEIDRDKISYKDQPKSIIEWDKLDAVEWLDITNWVAARKIRDENPEWKILYRDALNKELVGKIIACEGNCFLNRGSRPSRAQFATAVREGDEVNTGKNSILWMVTVDGTIFRFSSDTSVAFNEINVSEDEIFFLTRLNYGHIHAEARFVGEYNFGELGETDISILPLGVTDANREFFAREEFKQREKSDFTFITDDHPGQKNQLAKLNAFMQEPMTKKTHFLLVTPNLNLSLKNAHFDIFYEMFGKSFFRIRNQREYFTPANEISTTAEAFFRGYNNQNSQPITLGTWYEMNQSGREIVENDTLNGSFGPVDFLTKRVPSLFLAREILLRKFAQFSFIATPDDETFAKEYGYRIWRKEEEKNQRFAWLKEYTRRVETTQLGSMEKIKKTEPILAFSNQYYISGIENYLKWLKVSNQKAQREVAEMSDLEYYVWVVKNNK